MSVIAIGIDAAEPTLVRELVEAGRLPALRRLLGQGAWRGVRSSAGIASGSIWPTFMTGTPPLVHGVHADWTWKPDTMTAGRCRADMIVPFWKPLADAGVRVGVIDVPYAPRVGLREGFEIGEWGPHDVLEGHMRAEPAGVGELVGRIRPHPLSVGLLNPAGPGDARGLRAVIEACLSGIQARGELVRLLIRERRPQCAIVEFSEVHHASHFLWHTIAPDHPLYAGDAYALTDDRVRSGLTTIFEAVDREIGSILDLAGDDAAAMVFSLHGMRPATGVVTLLGPLLCEQGFSRLSDWTRQSGRERLLSMFAAMKRHSPSALKSLYYRTVPQAATRRLARPTLLPAYDWAATRAFAWPSDQHGWIRVNLKGREAAGTVEPDDYDATCDELEAFLLSLTDAADRPLVQEVVRPASRVEEAAGSTLPDLVVHWADPAYASSLKIAGSRLVAHTVAPYITGQHTLDGFCISRGLDTDRAGDGVMQSTEMCRLIAEACHATTADPVH